MTFPYVDYTEMISVPLNKVIQSFCIVFLDTNTVSYIYEIFIEHIPNLFGIWDYGLPLTQYNVIKGVCIFRSQMKSSKIVLYVPWW